ncbi:MAG: hypothetical protein PF961_23380, partial [Planctomycetota bacterium]|nr:hypothetical protein [Planctomycetota bacterium]
MYRIAIALIILTHCLAAADTSSATPTDNGPTQHSEHIATLVARLARSTGPNSIAVLPLLDPWAFQDRALKHELDQAIMSNQGYQYRRRLRSQFQLDMVLQLRHRWVDYSILHQHLTENSATVIIEATQKQSPDQNEFFTVTLQQHDKAWRIADLDYTLRGLPLSLELAAKLLQDGDYRVEEWAQGLPDALAALDLGYDGKTQQAQQALASVANEHFAVSVQAGLTFAQAVTEWSATRNNRTRARKALAACQSSIDLAPDALMPYYIAALVAENAQDYPRAHRYAEAYMQRGGPSFEMHRVAGQALIKIGDLDAAHTHYRAWALAQPNSDDALQGLAQCHPIDQGEALRQAARACPNLAEMFNRLRHQVDDAARATLADELSKVDPNDPALLRYQADQALDQNQIDTALGLLIAANQHDKDQYLAEYILTLAEEHERLQDIITALNNPTAVLHWLATPWRIAAHANTDSVAEAFIASLAQREDCLQLIELYRAKLDLRSHAYQKSYERLAQIPAPTDWNQSWIYYNLLATSAVGSGHIVDVCKQHGEAILNSILWPLANTGNAAALNEACTAILATNATAQWPIFYRAAARTALGDYEAATQDCSILRRLDENGDFDWSLAAVRATIYAHTKPLRNRRTARNDDGFFSDRILQQATVCGELNEANKLWEIASYPQRQRTEAIRSRTRYLIETERHEEVFAKLLQQLKRPESQSWDRRNLLKTASIWLRHTASDDQLDALISADTETLDAILDVYWDANDTAKFHHLMQRHGSNASELWQARATKIDGDREGAVTLLLGASTLAELPYHEQSQVISFYADDQALPELYDRSDLGAKLSFNAILAHCKEDQSEPLSQLLDRHLAHYPDDHHALMSTAQRALTHHHNELARTCLKRLPTPCPRKLHQQYTWADQVLKLREQSLHVDTLTMARMTPTWEPDAR